MSPGPLLEHLLGRRRREPSRPRYTRDVGHFWLRRVSLLVLLVLAVFPVSGTVCAVLCLPAASGGSESGGHHTSAPPCHEPVSGGPKVEGRSGHGCDRHNSPAHEATAALTAGVRSDISLISVTQLIEPGTPNLFPLTSVRTHSGSSPPGPATTTRTPLVLRI